MVTTLAGQGGGLVLLLACSALYGPHAALGMTAPALLLGNAHRAVLFRRAVHRPKALRLVAGAIPGALAGGFAAGAMPAWAIKVLLVLVTALAVAKAVFKLRLDAPHRTRRALPVAGFVLGGLTGTAGGAGFLVAPLLLASGLSGAAFVGTTSTVAVGMHVGRVVAYGATGMLSRELLLPTALLAVAIFAGNAAGERLRRRLPERASSALEWGVMLMCATLSVCGLA
jgi:uncharacterized membrane protein YfcA